MLNLHAVFLLFKKVYLILAKTLRFPARVVLFLTKQLHRLLAKFRPLSSRGNDPKADSNPKLSSRGCTLNKTSSQDTQASAEFSPTGKWEKLIESEAEVLDDPVSFSSVPRIGQQSSVPSSSVMEHTVTVTYGSPKPTSTYRMSYEIENLVAITTKVEYERYERNQPYERHDDQPYTIEPFTKSFSRPNLPDGWTTFVHPEGVRYFLKETQPIPVLTEAYIYSPEIHNQIESYISQIFSYINRNSIAFENSFLVLELRQSGRCGYYFVDHTNKCLFWLDPFEFSHLLDPLKIPYTASLVGLVMHSHYWYHNELFPHVYQSTEGDLSEISDILVYSIGDLLTAGPNSVVSYDLDTLKASLELVKHFQKQDQSLRRRSPGGARFIYRMASYLYHDRFLNLHGEPGARLDAGQSIYGPQPEKNSLLMKILSPLMIYGPDSHLYRLEETTVDYMVSKRSWEGFAEKIFEEWRETILYATVVLNANVAFLAIQSVDEAAAPGRQTDSQRASYFSVLTSLGSIIFGLLLVRQHREVMTTQFVVNRSASHLGLETLAMMFSLPYTLLMWSMISFLLAFLLLLYHSQDVLVISQTSVWEWPLQSFSLLFGRGTPQENSRA